MNKLGNKTVSLSSLELPGDMDRRMKTEKVKALAGDFESLCNLHPPVVRKMGNRLTLLAGRDRIAAFMCLAYEKVDVLLVDCDDLEAEQIELSENLQRREYDPDERAEMNDLHLDILTRREEARGVQATPVKPGRGRPKTARGKAMATLAEKQGIKPDSIRRQRDRRRKKNKDILAKKDQPPIEMFGVEMDDEGQWLAQVEASIKYQKDASLKLSLATRALNSLLSANLPSVFRKDPGDKLEEIVKSISLLRQKLDEDIPTHLCVACKASVDFGEGKACPCCNGAALCGKRVVTGSPDELLDTENVHVLKDKKFVPIEGLAPEEGSIFDEEDEG